MRRGILLVALAVAAVGCAGVQSPRPMKTSIPLEPTEQPTDATRKEEL